MKGVVSILVFLSHKRIFHQSKLRNISEEQRFLLHRCGCLKSFKISIAEKPQCVSFLSRRKRRWVHSKYYFNHQKMFKPEAIDFTLDLLSIIWWILRTIWNLLQATGGNTNEVWHKTADEKFHNSPSSPNTLTERRYWNIMW